MYQLKLLILEFHPKAELFLAHLSPEFTEWFPRMLSCNREILQFQILEYYNNAWSVKPWVPTVL